MIRPGHKRFSVDQQSTANTKMYSNKYSENYAFNGTIAINININMNNKSCWIAKSN